MSIRGFIRRVMGDTWSLFLCLIGSGTRQIAYRASGADGADGTMNSECFALFRACPQRRLHFLKCVRQRRVVPAHKVRYVFRLSSYNTCHYSRSICADFVRLKFCALSRSVRRVYNGGFGKVEGAAGFNPATYGSGDRRSMRQFIEFIYNLDRVFRTMPRLI